MRPRVRFPSGPGDWSPGLVPPRPSVPSSDGLPLKDRALFSCGQNGEFGNQEGERSYLNLGCQSIYKAKNGTGRTQSQRGVWEGRVYRHGVPAVTLVPAGEQRADVRSEQGPPLFFGLCLQSRPRSYQCDLSKSLSSEAPTDRRLRSETPQHRPSVPGPCYLPDPPPPGTEHPNSTCHLQLPQPGLSWSPDSKCLSL